MKRLQIGKGKYIHLCELLELSCSQPQFRCLRDDHKRRNGSAYSFLSKFLTDTPLYSV